MADATRRSALVQQFVSATGASAAEARQYIEVCGGWAAPDARAALTSASNRRQRSPVASMATRSR